MLAKSQVLGRCPLFGKWPEMPNALKGVTRMTSKMLALGIVLFAFLALATPVHAGVVNVLYDANHTVTTGQLTISIPQILMQEGHAYTVTTRSVSGQVSAYGDPYVWSVTYDSRFFGGKRVVYQSRHANDSSELAHLQEDMWNASENRAEFWLRCETSAPSCFMRVTVYEREAGTFDRKTFYREGVEYGVIDGQFSLHKDFYHPTKKNGDYGLQVSYEAGRYMYLYRSDGFDAGGTNALSLWIRSGGSIDENDLRIALTTGDHYLLTDWLPMADYVDIAQSQTWYKAVIPLADLNPSGSSVRGLAIRSDIAGSVFLDDIQFTSESLSPLKLPLAAGEQWYLTTEVGGNTDCTNPGGDPFHAADKAYYSIDFAPRTLSGGNGSTPLANVLILAAGAGKVIEAPSLEDRLNGYYVRIDHDEPYDGSGLTSYYLHLRSSASALLGDIVPQGKILGYMGDSGEGTGVHLHFQLKYNGNSTITASNLSNIRVDGLLMTDYDAGCRLNIPPTGFYLSTNIPRQ